MRAGLAAAQDDNNAFSGHTELRTAAYSRVTHLPRRTARHLIAVGSGVLAQLRERVGIDDLHADETVVGDLEQLRALDGRHEYRTIVH